MTDFLYSPVLPVLASPPALPEAGMMYVRASDYHVLVYDGAAWVDQAAGGGGGGGGLLQSAFAQVTTDTTTTSTTFIDLLTVNVTASAAGFLLIDFTSSATGSNATNTIRVEFQVLVDGVALRGAGSSVNANAPQTAALTHRVAVAAGPRVVKVQWRVSANTGRIRPVSSLVEHASLRVCEVSA
jgi:hypothetical protein